MDQPRERHRTQCLECGKWYRVLPPHLRTHGWTAEDYQLKFGIPASVPLVCEEWSEAITLKNIERDSQRFLTARGPKPGFKMAESTRVNRREHYQRMNELGRNAAYARAGTAERREALRPYPVTIGEAAERLGCARYLAQKFLSYCLSRGHVRRIAEGVYDEVKPDADA